MTSLDMAGFSVTLLALPGGDAGADLLALLDASTAATAWPGRAIARAPQLVNLEVPVITVSADLPDDHDHRVARAIDAACRALLDQEAHLTQLDQVVGDGDLGTALARGCPSVAR